VASTTGVAGASGASSTTIGGASSTDRLYGVGRRAAVVAGFFVLAAAFVVAG
jgi:hypothetical protein